MEDCERLRETLAKVLIETGARKILDDINVERNRRVDEAKTTGEQR